MIYITLSMKSASWVHSLEALCVVLMGTSQSCAALSGMGIWAGEIAVISAIKGGDLTNVAKRV